MPYVKCLSVHSTPARTLAYIVNPDKTENLLYVSGLNCPTSPTLAYSDMKFVFENYSSSKFDEKELENKKTPVKLFHFIQSFPPHENISPEMVHKIGTEWAKKAFGEERQIIISTHVDKGHIHNHIIINPYNLNGKKYQSNKKTLESVRNLSDAISINYGIKIIEKKQNSKSKSLSYKEWDEKKKGSSWKQIIRNKIDKLVYNTENLEQLLNQLTADGYEIKKGKYIAVKAPEQQRFVRIKSLGEGYDEESLKDRIALAIEEKNTQNEQELQKSDETNDMENLYVKRFNEVKNLVLTDNKIQKKFDKKQPYSLKNDYTICHIVYQLQTLRNDKISSINMLENKMKSIEKLYEETRIQINKLLQKEEKYNNLISNIKNYFALKNKHENLTESEKIKLKIAESYMKTYNLPDDEKCIYAIINANQKIHAQVEELTKKFNAAESKINEYKLIKNWYNEMIKKDYITKLVEQKKQEKKLKK